MRIKDIYGNYIKGTNANVQCQKRQVTGNTDQYSAVVRFLDGNKKLVVHDNEAALCIADNGYIWLVLLPINEYWCMTAMYNDKMKIVEWYFDITKRNFLDENEMPCIDDLYLYLVLLPDGQIIMLDEDELLDALSRQVISQAEVDFAYAVYQKLANSKWMDTQYLSTYCYQLLSEFDKGHHDAELTPGAIQSL